MFKVVFIGIICIILSGLVLIGIAMPIVVRSAHEIQVAQRSIMEAESAFLQHQDVEAAVRHLYDASATLRSAKNNVDKLGYARLIPWIAPQWKGAQATLEAAALSTNAVASIASHIAPVISVLTTQEHIEIGALSASDRTLILNTITQSVPELQGAKAELKLALMLMQSNQPFWYPDLEQARQKFMRSIGAFSQMLDDGVPLLETLPPLLGFPEQKTYLFVLENNAEMRPTGGFIGTYGIVTLDKGHLQSFFTDDVYNLDRFTPAARRPLAPAHLAKYLEQPRWYLRDANWDPDFPTSAKTILQFYQDELREAQKNPRLQSTSSQIDGVIAITPEAIRPLLTLTGPITVQDQTFTSENLTDALEYEVEINFRQRGIPRPQRKDIISELGHELISKILAMPVSKWPDVVHSVRTALDEKHLLIYTGNPPLDASLAAQGWNGALEYPVQDYLSIFDANLFSLKTDPYVSRSIFYTVSQDAVGFMGDVEIVYAYPAGGPAWKTKGYRTWTRVYVPKGSVLISTSGAMVDEGVTRPGEVETRLEHDKTVFGAFLAVEVGEVKRLRFTYRLPAQVQAAIAGGQYELLIQKQPGTIGHNLTVEANFGKVPRAWSPTGLSAHRDNETLRWQMGLRKDQVFHVEF